MIDSFKSGKRASVIFNVIEWSLFIVFSVLAALFVKDVWVQFQAKETFMGQSLEPMTKLPSMTLCTKPSWSHSWSHSEGIIKINTFINRTWKTLKENEILYYDSYGSGIVLYQISDDCFWLRLIPGSKIDRRLSRPIRGTKVTFRPKALNFKMDLNTFFTSWILIESHTSL